MSTYLKQYKYISETRPERPKGNARRIRIGDDLISADRLDFLADIPICHQAWDEDDWAWLVKYKEKQYILFTNQSMLVVTKDVDGFLQELSDRYAKAVAMIRDVRDISKRDSGKLDTQPPSPYRP